MIADAENFGHSIFRTASIQPPSDNLGNKLYSIFDLNPE